MNGSKIIHVRHTRTHMFLYKVFFITLSYVVTKIQIVRLLFITLMISNENDR